MWASELVCVVTVGVKGKYELPLGAESEVLINSIPAPRLNLEE